MKKILVPTDFSKYSDYALRIAKYIAKTKQASIKILHVVEEAYTPRFSATGDMIFEDDMHRVYILKLMEQTTKRLFRISESIKKEGIECESAVVVDKAYTGIINDITSTECDLVVMGSQGTGNVFDEFFIGSTTEKVIRRSKSPVLTVKSKPTRFNIKNVLFASDFEEDISHIIQRVSKFCDIFNSKLHLLRVNTPGKFLSGSMSKQKIEQVVKDYNIKNEHTINVYSDKTEEEGIIHFAKEIKADLIALGTHGRSGFSQFFKGSIAEDVAGNSFLPVLTYNIPFEEKDKPPKTEEARHPAQKTTVRSVEKQVGDTKSPNAERQPVKKETTEKVRKKK